jgi:hypothetical protein
MRSVLCNPSLSKCATICLDSNISDNIPEVLALSWLHYFVCTRRA